MEFIGTQMRQTDLQVEPIAGANPAAAGSLSFIVESNCGFIKGLFSASLRLCVMIRVFCFFVVSEILLPRLRDQDDPSLSNPLNFTLLKSDRLLS